MVSPPCPPAAAGASPWQCRPGVCRPPGWWRGTGRAGWRPGSSRRRGRPRPAPGCGWSSTASLRQPWSAWSLALSWASLHTASMSPDSSWDHSHRWYRLKLVSICHEPLARCSWHATPSWCSGENSHSKYFWFIQIFSQLRHNFLLRELWTGQLDTLAWGPSCGRPQLCETGVSTTTITITITIYNYDWQLLPSALHRDCTATECCGAVVLLPGGAVHSSAARHRNVYTVTSCSPPG